MSEAEPPRDMGIRSRAREMARRKLEAMPDSGLSEMSEEDGEAFLDAIERSCSHQHVHST